jgi:diguanylate cyclase (GGDEF)-like protein
MEVTMEKSEFFDKALVIDDLTSLYNIRYFRQNYDMFINSHANPKLIAIDFTKLKYINDTFGHAGGDACLTSFGIILKKVFLDEICVRRSGDEFLILTGKSSEEIEEAFEKVNELINEYFTLRMIPFNYAFNSGCVNTEHSIDLSLDKADVMMYYAKKNSKLLEYFDDNIYNEAKTDENYLKHLLAQIDNGEIGYSSRKAFSINKGETHIRDLYSRDANNNSIIIPEKIALLQSSPNLRQLDYTNLRNIILNSSVTKGSKLIINIHPQIIFSKDLDFRRFIIALTTVSDNNPENFIISINVNGVGNEWINLIPKIELLKKMGFGVCINGLDLSESNPTLNIWSETDINYIKIAKKSWFDAKLNPKKQKLLETVVPEFIDSGTLPIFMKVEGEDDLNFIKKINHDSLYIGNVTGREKPYQIKPLKK